MIPIYRAKKIGSYEWVEGHLSRNVFTADFSIIGDSNRYGYGFNYYIDASTLAIHFPNMIDKNGKKIFASLSEDGVGGDKLKSDYSNEPYRYVYNKGQFSIVTGDNLHDFRWTNVFKEAYEVIGIHKGNKND